MNRRLCAVLLAALCFVAGGAWAEPSVRTLTLPSAAPSGDPVVDRIWLNVYRPVGPGPHPGVVLLHPLGEERNRLMGQFARHLCADGMLCVTVELPYHLRRTHGRDMPLSHFVNPHARVAAQAFAQSVADVSAVVDWLAGQPDVDADRLGVVGVSLGAILAHVAMGRDGRLKAGVAMLGGGDLPGLFRRSVLFDLWYPRSPRILAEPDAALVRGADPLTFSAANHPRHVLMIQAARDMIVPPSSAVELWRALGKPPIIWCDTNHFALSLGLPSVMRATSAYLRGVWDGHPPTVRELPPVHLPAIRVGALAGLDLGVGAAVTWQMIPIGWRPDHMALGHLDVAWSNRGPMVGLAVTLNPHMDLGIGRRFHPSGVRPYLSFHFAL